MTAAWNTGVLVNAARLPVAETGSLTTQLSRWRSQAGGALEIQKRRGWNSRNDVVP